MKASIYTQYGPPNVLELRDIPKPHPKENEILIKVYAATVNRTDCAMLRADLPIMRLTTGLTKPRNPILGTDFAGQIEAIGSKVKRFGVGDRLFGFDDMGLSSHAEYLCVSEKEALGKIPEDMDYNEAAALIEGAHYAINFLNKVNIKKGDKVLVNGATGAIGSAAVQLLKYFGATVVATCKAKHSDLIKNLGAKSTIDYEEDDFTLLKEQFDFVFDTVGKSTFGQCKNILKPGGVYISSELGPKAQNSFLSLWGIFHKGKRVKFPFPLNRQSSVDLVVQLVKEDAFKPLIDKRYPLDQIKNAFENTLSGEKVGNVVISISE